MTPALDAPVIAPRFRPPVAPPVTDAVAIVCAYNEERHIEAVVRGAARHLPVVVVDDGSRDGTVDVASRAGAWVLPKAVNAGKGAALVTGFRWALRSGYRAAICLDGDGQHDTDEIPRFIERWRAGEHAVFGNRMTDVKTMPAARLAVNRLMGTTVSTLAGYRIPDPQCGFRLYSRECLSRLRVKTSRYDAESEIAIQVARNGYRISSIPVRTIYQATIKSKIRPIIDTIRFLRIVVYYCMIRHPDWRGTPPL
ncbi:MAG: glycosyltransferase family 2 protein [Candidatus Brocadiae bacterium]|nr:glycosyltransferase family 2 protein [Candidatus Brocadiia bacterium]